MTPQSKGFSWSAGIHGMIFAVFAALQISAASEQRPAVIDFILADKAAPAALQAPPPPAPRQDETGEGGAVEENCGEARRSEAGNREGAADPAAFGQRR